MNKLLKYFVFTHPGKVLPGVMVVVSKSENRARYLAAVRLSKMKKYNGEYISEDGGALTLEAQGILRPSDAKIIYDWDGDY